MKNPWWYAYLNDEQIDSMSDSRETPPPNPEHLDPKASPISYQITPQGIIFKDSRDHSSRFVRSDEVDMVISGCVDFIKRYGMKDAYGRSADVDSYLRRLRNKTD